jgi:hypothetical protein
MKRSWSTATPELGPTRTPSRASPSSPEPIDFSKMAYEPYTSSKPLPLDEDGPGLFPWKNNKQCILHMREVVASYLTSDHTKPSDNADFIVVANYIYYNFKKKNFIILQDTHQIFYVKRFKTLYEIHFLSLHNGQWKDTQHTSLSENPEILFENSTVTLRYIEQHIQKIM